MYDAFGGTGVDVRLENVDSGDTNYKFYNLGYEGTIQEETTLVRTGGSNDGVTTYSMRMASSSAVNYPALPLESLCIPVRIDATGSSKTISIEILHDSQGSGASGDFQDDEIGLEIQYSGTSASTLYAYADSEKTDILTTASDYSNSSETWTTTGMTSPVKQTLSVTITPQELGYYLLTVNLYKASSVVYIDVDPNVA